MLIRLMLAPAGKHRWGADYVRQQVTRWEHFRRGNALYRMIVAVPDTTLPGEEPRTTLDEVARLASEVVGGSVELSNSPWVAAIRYGNVPDTLLFERLFRTAFAVMARVRTAFADKAYDAHSNRDLCRKSRAEPHIRKCGQPHGSGLGKRRWPVERTNAWLPENKRLGLRYDRLGFVVESLLQAACAFLVAPRLTREF